VRAGCLAHRAIVHDCSEESVDCLLFRQIGEFLQFVLVSGLAAPCTSFERTVVQIFEIGAKFVAFLPFRHILAELMSSAADGVRQRLSPGFTVIARNHDTLPGTHVFDKSRSERLRSGISKPFERVDESRVEGALRLRLGHSKEGELREFERHLRGPSEAVSLVLRCDGIVNRRVIGRVELAVAVHTKRTKACRRAPGLRPPILASPMGADEQLYDVDCGIDAIRATRRSAVSSSIAGMVTIAIQPASSASSLAW
jgi:hypothetical protein